MRKWKNIGATILFAYLAVKSNPSVIAKESHYICTVVSASTVTGEGELTAGREHI
jgi:hypothetical protein